jgi:glucokinase
MTIGVDLGGTNIRAGIECEGVIIEKRSTLLTDKESLASTLSQLINLIRPLTEFPVDGIGIGVPSVVDIERGIVHDVVNIPSWKRVELKDILESEFNIPVWVNNDVNCFTIGEQRFGKAQAYNSVVGLSIGTGMGSGIIINDRLFNGANCGAGEMGMLPYLDHNFEHYVSGNFFETFHGINAVDANNAAQAGSTDALNIWAEFGKHLSEAIKAVLYAYDPEVIVLGGSISKGYTFFKEAMLKGLADFAYPESVRKLRIFQSENENIALLGASAIAQQELQLLKSSL